MTCGGADRSKEPPAMWGHRGEPLHPKPSCGCTKDQEIICGESAEGCSFLPHCARLPLRWGAGLEVIWRLALYKGLRKRMVGRQFTVKGAHRTKEPSVGRAGGRRLFESMTCPS